MSLHYNDANGKINHSLIAFDQNVSKFHFKDGSPEKGEKNLWSLSTLVCLGSSLSMKSNKPYKRQWLLTLTMKKEDIKIAVSILLFS